MALLGQAFEHHLVGVALADAPERIKRAFEQGCQHVGAGGERGEATEDTESTTAWEDVHPDYVERFGPEAATIGPP